MNRDEQARRELADVVKATVLAGSAQVALLAYEGQAENSGDAARIQAQAAAAVVLASDLRAPAEARQQFVDRLTVAVREGRATFTPFLTVKRDRLAEVERLLASAMGEDQVITPTAANRALVERGLAELRAILGGQ